MSALICCSLDSLDSVSRMPLLAFKFSIEDSVSNTRDCRSSTRPFSQAATCCSACCRASRIVIVGSSQVGKTEPLRQIREEVVGLELRVPVDAKLPGDAQRERF